MLRETKVEKKKETRISIKLLLSGMWSACSGNRKVKIFSSNNTLIGKYICNNSNNNAEIFYRALYQRYCRRLNAISINCSCCTVIKGRQCPSPITCFKFCPLQFSQVEQSRVPRENHLSTIRKLLENLIKS